MRDLPAQAVQTLPALCAAASAAGAAGSNPEPGQPLQPQKRDSDSVPYPPVVMTRGDGARRSGLGFPRPGDPHPASHLTLPYWPRLALRTPRGVAIKRGPQRWDSGARISCRTCVPRSARALGGERRRSAVAWEEQVLRGSRAGPGLVRSGSRAEPELVAAGPGEGCAL